jgi:hypothetical protein
MKENLWKLFTTPVDVLRPKKKQTIVIITIKKIKNALLNILSDLFIESQIILHFFLCILFSVFFQRIIFQ